MNGQVMGARALAELLQGVRLDAGAGHINLQSQPCHQCVGPFHHGIQTEDTLHCHMTLGGYLGLRTVNVHPDQNS